MKNPIYTDREREFLFALARMVDQNLREEDDGVFETGFIRSHKDALITLCDAGVMEEVYPEKHYRDCPFRVFYARFRPKWESWLWNDTRGEVLQLTNESNGPESLGS